MNLSFNVRNAAAYCGCASPMKREPMKSIFAVNPFFPLSKMVLNGFNLQITYPSGQLNGKIARVFTDEMYST